MTDKIWGVPVTYNSRIEPLDVDAVGRYVANAEPSNQAEALEVCEDAGKAITQLQNALIELSEIGSPEVDAILDKYIARL